MSECIKCGAHLTANDVGAYKKFINRGSTEFMCINCLAGELNVTTELLYEKIEHFKRQGCTLFI